MGASLEGASLVSASHALLKGDISPLGVISYLGILLIHFNLTLLLVDEKEVVAIIILIFIKHLHPHLILLRHPVRHILKPHLR